MPTIILLDSSLSMARSWNTSTDSVEQAVKRTKLDYACRAIRRFLLQAIEKFERESISLFTFSSETKCVVDFTKDYSQILNVIDNVPIGDTSCVRIALERAFEACVKDAVTPLARSASAPYRVLLFTDGEFGLAESELNDEVLNILRRGATRVRDDHDALALHSFVLTDSDAPHVTGSESSALARLVSSVNRVALADVLESASDSDFLTVLCGTDNKSSTSAPSVVDADDWRLFPYFVVARNEPSLLRLVDALVEDAYAPASFTLRCGALRTKCGLLPRPVRERAVHFDESLAMPRRLTLTDRELRVVGCAPLAEIGAPPTSIRHVLIPMREWQPAARVMRTRSDRSTDAPASTAADADVPMSSDDGNNASNGGESLLQAANSAVLLHGALKAENLVAVVQVGPAWFALVHPRTDVKKRSNLVLTVLPPGCTCVPWLADTFSTIAVRRTIREAARQRRRRRERRRATADSGESVQSATEPKRALLSGEAKTTASTNLEADANDDSHSDASLLTATSDSESDTEIEGLILPPARGTAAAASYSAASAYQTWTRTSALHADVQRVLRSARKFEKQAAFFRELNRLKRFALQLGFVELLTYISTLIDGEYQAVVASGFSISDQPEKSHVAAQLRSVALQLRSPLALNPDYQILPAQAAVLTIPPPTTGNQATTQSSSAATAASTAAAVSANASSSSKTVTTTATSRAPAATPAAAPAAAPASAPAAAPAAASSQKH